jgi:hypothetical protein
LCWYFRDRVIRTICPDWPQAAIFLFSASWVARIKGMSHQYQAGGSLLYNILYCDYTTNFSIVGLDCLQFRPSKNNIWL